MELTGDGEVAQHGHLRRVPVMNVMRGELVIPLKRASVGIERQQGTGIKVVAGAIVAPVVRVGISGAVVDQVQRGVVRPRRPDGAAPLLITSVFGQVSLPFSPAPGTV